MQPPQEFDPNTWKCPCQGDSNVFVVRSEDGGDYHLMICLACGNWRRHIADMDQEIGKELPDEMQLALDERGEQIRAAPPPGMAVPADIASLPMPEQGTIMTCAYCEIVHPELKMDCPICGGSGPQFRAARMMDKQTSQMETFPLLFELEQFEERLREGDANEELAKEYRDKLVRLLEWVGLYQFDLKDALIERIKSLEWDHEIEPKNED